MSYWESFWKLSVFIFDFVFLILKNSKRKKGLGRLEKSVEKCMIVEWNKSTETKEEKFIFNTKKKHTKK